MEELFSVIISIIAGVIYILSASGSTKQVSNEHRKGSATTLPFLKPRIVFNISTYSICHFYSLTNTCP